MGLASTPCIRFSTSSRPTEYNSRIYGMSITGIRPANVTGPDKVRGSTDHVQCIVLPANGPARKLPQERHTCGCRCMWMMWPRPSFGSRCQIQATIPIYNTGGTPISMGDLADIVRGFLPDAQITFDSDGGREDSGNFLVDNSRLLGEFELEYPPFPHTGAANNQRGASRRRTAAGRVTERAGQVRGANDWLISIQDDMLVPFGAIHPGLEDKAGEVRRLRENVLIDTTWPRHHLASTPPGLPPSMRWARRR